MIIVLDPGHGGRDPGAVGRVKKVRESGVNLDVALRVEPELTKRGHRVLLTRIDDIFLELSARAALANNNRADWFVAIHTNSAENPQAHGIEVFHWPGSQKGVRLGAAILDQLIKATGRNSRGLKSGQFFVLQATKAPAVLVELPFLSNAVEEELLDDPTFRKNCATAIATGILTVAV